jgi:carboxypeptidase Q
MPLDILGGMKRTALVFALVSLAAPMSAQSPAWLEPYRPVAQRIITEAQSNDFTWQRLAELTDTFGHRLSGSETLEQAIDWAAAKMKEDGLENVRKEPVMVPKWVRGAESLDLVAPVKQRLVMLGLGSSVGTPAGGIEADVIVVKNFDEMTRRAAEIKGKIVLFNADWVNYGVTNQYRTAGPSRAAALGAVGVLVRSVGPMGLRTPHTGGTIYAADQPKLPAAAIPAEDANRFQRLQDRGTKIRVKLSMEAHFEADSQSYNVVGEIRGRELPNEVIVVGGHIDSWDVATGASDDGGGCIVTWDALRLMKKLGLRPRRTIRVVLFTNEENGTRGGTGYRDAHMAELKDHVMLLESDGGIFDPEGFGFTGPAPAKATVTAIASLLKSIGADPVRDGGGGADIGPSGTAGNIPMMSHLAAANYFLIHHTPADTIERITPKQAGDNAAAIAVMVYVIADLPWRLGTEK